MSFYGQFGGDCSRRLYEERALERAYDYGAYGGGVYGGYAGGGYGGYAGGGYGYSGFERARQFDRVCPQRDPCLGIQRDPCLGIQRDPCGIGIESQAECCNRLGGRVEVSSALSPINFTNPQTFRKTVLVAVQSTVPTAIPVSAGATFNPGTPIIIRDLFPVPNPASQVAPIVINMSQGLLSPASFSLQANVSRSDNCGPVEITLTFTNTTGATINVVGLLQIVAIVGYT